MKASKLFYLTSMEGQREVERMKMKRTKKGKEKEKERKIERTKSASGHLFPLLFSKLHVH